MNKRVEIIEKEELLERFFFRIVEARLRHSLYNGEMSEEITRLNFERGDSATVLMHDPKNDSIILTEQFRYPAYAKEGKGHPSRAWILELPAGSVESEEVDDPTQTMRREILEEVGYVAGEFKHVYSFFVSPGGTSERIHLYYVKVSSKDQVAEGGGLAHEGENLRVLHVAVKDALKWIEDGKIRDAKTIIGLQWMALNRNQLK